MAAVLREDLLALAAQDEQQEFPQSGRGRVAGRPVDVHEDLSRERVVVIRQFSAFGAE